MTDLDTLADLHPSRHQHADVLAEAALLGALMDGTAALALPVLEELHAADFYEPTHRHVYEAIRSVLADGGAPDLVTVAGVLRAQGLDGIAVCADLTASPHTALNISRYVKAIRETAALRTAARASQRYLDVCASQRGVDPSAIETLRDQAIVAAEATQARTRGVSAEDVVADALATITEEVRRARCGLMPGIATGFRFLDNLTGGWLPGIHFVCGWSSAGKSALLLSFLRAAAEAGHRWRLYSLDMRVSDLIVRWTQQVYDLDSERVQRRTLTEEDMRHVNAMATWTLERRCSFDAAARTVDEFVADAERHASEYDLVAVDTMQSIQYDAKKSQYELNCEIASKLKGLAKRLGKPVLVTAQLNNPPDRKETSKGEIAKPNLNQIEGARRFTQEAASVILVTRSDYGAEQPGAWMVPAEVRLAKTQRGRPGVCSLTWNARYGRFEEHECPVASHYEAREDRE